MKIDIELNFEKAEQEVQKLFVADELELMKQRYALLAKLRDFNSTSLAGCRKLIEKSVLLALERQFDDEKLIKANEYLKKQHKIVEVATGDLNILAQIERIMSDLIVVYNEGCKLAV